MRILEIVNPFYQHVMLLLSCYGAWKQPLAYFFINSIFQAEYVAHTISQVVEKLQEVGLHVIAVVTDMDNNFVKMAQILGVVNDKLYFEVNGRKIFYFFDPPHALKAVHNNFQANNIIVDTKNISWSYVETLYNIDKSKDNRLVPKLTESHIHPTNFEKMKVKFASQILSCTVSSALKTYISIGTLPEDAADIAQFIENIDKLFDMFNSLIKEHVKECKKAFEATDFQIQFLLYMKQYLSTITIYSKLGNDITNKVKTFKLWISNINSLLQLWSYLQSTMPDIKYLFMRRFNQDPVEHFFGQVRSLNGNAFNPTSIQFYFTFRKLFAIQYCNIDTGNCAAKTNV